MHSPGEVTAALELCDAGLSAGSVARLTGLPRSTVRDWAEGRVPGRVQAREPTALSGSLTPADLPPAYVYLLGVYLGDGCISAHRRGVYRMRVHLDVRYPGIVDECEAALRAVAPRNRVGRLSRRSHYTGRDEITQVDLSCYSKRWPALFPQHGPGRKHQRPIQLADWQRIAVQAAPELFLRGLIHSDGCRNINTGTNWRHPRYSFSNRSDDIRRLFTWACDLLGLHWTVAPHTVYVSRKVDVARMDEFIGPKS